jgi:hypothetical protein
MRYSPPLALARRRTRRWPNAEALAECVSDVVHGERNGGSSSARGDVGCRPDLPDVDRRDARVVLEVRLSVSRLASFSSAVSTAYMLPSLVGASTPGLLCGSECIGSASVAAPTSSTAHPGAGTSHGGSKAVQARRARPLVKLAYSAQTVPHGYRLLRIFATSKDPAVAALMSGPRSLRSDSPASGSRGKLCSWGGDLEVDLLHVAGRDLWRVRRRPGGLDQLPGTCKAFPADSR